MKRSSLRTFSRIRRPLRFLFGSEVSRLVLVGFAVGSLAYVSTISDTARAELLSNVTILV